MTAAADSPDIEQVDIVDLDLSAPTHFRVLAHAASFHVIDHLRRIGTGEFGPVLERHPFLADYFDALIAYLPPDLSWDESRRWWPDVIDGWERGDEIELPLRSLASHGAMGWVGRLQTLVCGLVEEDSRFGGIFAELTGTNNRRPTVETLAAITAERVGDPSAAVASILHLLELGALTVANGSDPRADWQLSVRPELWDALAGDRRPQLASGLHHLSRTTAPNLADLVLPSELSSRAAQLVSVLADQAVDVLAVRGPAGSDRLLFVRALARELGSDVLYGQVDRVGADEWRRVGPLAAAFGAVPVAELDLAPGETVELGSLRGYRGPVIIVLSATGGLDLRSSGQTISIDFPILTRNERRRRWHIALPAGTSAELDEIARRCSLQGAHIDAAAAAATSLAKLDDARSVDADHVATAASQLNRQLLDTLADGLRPAGDWASVVVGDFAADKLAELETRCRHREELSSGLGPAFDSTSNHGVRALFTGASGTGKTLAARVLASQLRLDVYRVDLSAIVNKYIGETEKNLHRVLSIAEELDVVLLIDEGDSLLGRRTDVRSANDRYANLETNFLLQRLESYRGIVLVTTNEADSIDIAFQRRMDVVVSFLPPTVNERLEIWRLHLPESHRVPGVVLAELAERCMFTGGQIRNAALHATLIAVDGGIPVESAHLRRAVASEYQKAGAVSPFDPSGRPFRISRARAFQESLS